MIKEFKLWENEIPAYREDADCPNRVTAYIHKEGVHPAMVVYPGGGYSMRASHEGGDIAEFYYENGFNAFVVDYRVAPNRHPAPLLDAQRTVKLVRLRAEEWGVDPERVFVIGFSAGAHLAGCVATMEDICRVGDELDEVNARPNGAILCYPVISSDPTIVNAHLGSFNNLLGERAEELRDAFSLDKNVSEDTCPCFLFHTMEDATVPVQNTFCMLEALRAHNIPAEAFVTQYGYHGVGLAKGMGGCEQWPALTLDWLRRLCIK